MSDEPNFTTRATEAFNALKAVIQTVEDSGWRQRCEARFDSEFARLLEHAAEPAHPAEA